MAQPYIIAISGKQRSGKDTLAKALLSLLPDYKIIPLATPIKEHLADRWKVSTEFIESVKTHPEVRAHLIAIGNYFRTPTSLLTLWDEVLDSFDGGIVIPDIRLPEELKGIIMGHRPVITVRVEAIEENRRLRGTLSNEDDPTETALDYYENWDKVVHNNFKKDIFCGVAQSIVHMLK